MGRRNGQAQLVLSRYSGGESQSQSEGGTDEDMWATGEWKCVRDTQLTWKQQY